MLVCELVVIFRTYLFVRALFGKAPSSDTGSLSGHIGRGPCAIGAL